MKKEKSKYFHNQDVHNLDSSTRFVSFLYEVFQPKSVIDIGCGLGNFLYGFKQLGVSEVLGVDGPWIDREKLSNYLEENEFLEHDLEKPLNLNKQYDLVISLEVGEHLSENAAKTHVENLTSVGKIIIFSAAIPHQGGQNHINEQWQSYWSKLFASVGFSGKDIIRPNLWENAEIPWWYRQNSFAYVHEDLFINIEAPIICDVVHPELYNAKVKSLHKKDKELRALQTGSLGVFVYVKLLVKSIKNMLS